MQFEEPSDTTGQAAGRVRLPLPPVGVVDEPLVPGGEPSVELKDHGHGQLSGATERKVANLKKEKSTHAECVTAPIASEGHTHIRCKR